MIIHPNFIFAHIPRCGGNFVEKYCLQNIENSKRTKQSHIGLMDTKDIFEKPTFCTIRNPFDWYVSWWEYSKDAIGSGFIKEIYSDGRDNNFNKFVEYILNRNDGESAWVNFPIMNKLDIGMLTFKFLRIVSNRKIVFSLPPSNIKKDIIKEHILVNYIININKNFNSNLLQLFRDILFPVITKEQENKLLALEKINISNRKDYKEYYDKDTIELIKYKDRLIFELFNYSY